MRIFLFMLFAFGLILSGMLLLSGTSLADNFGDGSYADGGYYGGYGDGGYESGYTSSYTGAYTDSYTGGYEGGYTSGYEGGYTGSYEACYGSCTPTPAVSGFVYEDVDSSGTYNTGDRGVSATTFGEIVTVQVIRPAYTVPAYTTGGYCETTSTDANGNPTGQTCYPAVDHPAVSYPDTVVGSGNTDIGGHYSVTGFPAGTYKIHHTKEPLWPGWTRTTPNDVVLAINSSVNQSFGIHVPPFSQNLPQGACVGPNPNIHTSWNSFTGPGLANYRILYADNVGGGQQQTGLLPSTAISYDFSPSTTALTTGKQYSFIIGAYDVSGNLLGYSDSAWSSQKFGTYTLYPSGCGSLPSVALYLNGTNPIFPIFAVNQNAARPNLTWVISNANSNQCPVGVTSSNPNSPTVPPAITALWNGTRPPTSGGPVAIPTDIPAELLFTMTCFNGAGSITGQIQLNINHFPPAYFQTTGGDVHSNETIYITPPN